MSSLVTESGEEMSPGAIEVTMPATGSSDAACVVAWHVRAGSSVLEDDPICTVEIGNTHAIVNSPASGIVRAACAGVRAMVESGAPLALLDAAPSVHGTLVPAPELPKLSDFHSPAVRRMAEQFGVELDEVEGTGRDGRVTREDVLAASHQSPAGV